MKALTIAAVGGIAAALIAGPAGAQTTKPTEVQRDRQEIRQDKKEIREDTKEIQQDRREIRRDRRQLKKDITAGDKEGDILFLRFDLELLREEPGILRTAFRWFSEEVRRRPAHESPPPHVFLDEVHKLRRWSEEVKHLGDTFPVRLLLTGSSSVLVARGGRESLAGRVFTTELPTFSLREVLECWATR
jgi:hypothetical protein